MTPLAEYGFYFRPHRLGLKSIQQYLYFVLTNMSYPAPPRPPGREPPSPGYNSAPVDPNAFVGIATMKEDGTIVLQMYIGNVLLSYPPTHKDYHHVKAHLEKGESPMQPGGPSRAAKPFPASW